MEETLLLVEKDRRVADELVSQLGLPASPCFDDVVTRVTDVYGKPLRLEPVADRDLSTLTGLWIDTHDVGYVFFRSADPIVYRLHSIFHEFGHILSEHENCEALRALGDVRLEESKRGRELRRARSRELFNDPSERMAEVIAYALSRRVLNLVTNQAEAIFG